MSVRAWTALVLAFTSGCCASEAVTSWISPWRWASIAIFTIAGIVLQRAFDPKRETGS